MTAGRPLLALRWQMVRSRRARRGFVALAAAVPVLCVAAVVGGLLAPRDRSLDVTPARARRRTSPWPCSPSLAPLVAGGGNELFPAEQLDAYPVTSRTVYRASLALTPLNLAWTTQLVALLGLTAYVRGRDRADAARRCSPAWSSRRCHRRRARRSRGASSGSGSGPAARGRPGLVAGSGRGRGRLLAADPGPDGRCWTASPTTGSSSARSTGADGVLDRAGP